ncbi:ROK family transcriptional regulator [Phytohabitans aurantiacus]|jgi:predicted NBD/HSP70 family sugar kinase|uniref:Transcriptional regulator n=1 Tax=Phytohabitans aurantiacus TaxID=3016789 RepID=A0ABQ5QSA4_9ACTN|nr:ROK family transcriptional regulator [Phytohabitans aurantiacus]GLH96751.1 transcriptional regulator [Phytohabitans aurantiacus]
MERTVAVGTKFMLEVNASAILTHLRSAGRASVSALAKQAGLSRQAVSRSLAVLESMGLVEISAPDRAATPTGRPPQMVRFRAEAGHVLGVDMQPGHARIVVADLAGDITSEATVSLPRKGLSRALTAAVGRVLDEAGLRPGDIWHVSAAAPGIVDPATGHFTLSVSMPEVVGDTILAGLRAAVEAPVYVDNDVKLATTGERWRGTPHAEDALVFIDWGERIGAGIVLHGQLFRGASNDAGDIGYLDLCAPPASEGDEDLGPFERWVGTRELLRLTGRAVTLPELAAAAGRGEDWAVSAIGTVGARFAKGVAAIRALLDPDVIVIGGDITQLGTGLLDAVTDALRAEQLAQPRLEISALGADAIIHGAIRHSLSWVERERFDVSAIRRV